jgi:ADP-ribose pyrophosphatase YjhB (NUDIX family)
MLCLTCSLKRAACNIFFGTVGQMTDELPPRFLEWAREIQALAQTGFHYAQDDYQRDRCKRLMHIAAEMISQNSGVDGLQLEEAFTRQIGYATPKIDVRAAVFRDQKILMVRERADGRWTMPGGWADVGDTPSEAAEREAWEEAGFHVRALKVVGVYDANRTNPLEVFHAFKIVFLCDIVNGEARPSLETSEVGFWSEDEMPDVFSGGRTTPRQVRDAFNALRNPDCPTVFD